MVRVGKGQAQVLDLFFEQEAGGRRLQILGDAYRRCMGAVSCAEGVVNVDICVGSQCFGKFRVVFSLAGMEAHVLQQQNVAVIHLIDHPFYIRANAIRRHFYRGAEMLRETGSDGCEAELGLGTILGPTKV